LTDPSEPGTKTAFETQRLRVLESEIAPTVVLVKEKAGGQLGAEK
jgi:hypothetical protein